MNFHFDEKYRQSGIKYLCGIDEVGRGPLAGPVVAAAVIFRQGTIIDGIDDSKKLSPKTRQDLDITIRDEAIAFGIGSVDADEIDRINILQATFLAMKRAVKQLKVEPDYILTDGRDYPGFARDDIDLIRGEAIIKGDQKSASIAAASILAKVYRDQLMNEFAGAYPEYGFDQHKGYATKLHREMILKCGTCPIHRQSFLKKLIPETVNRILDFDEVVLNIKLQY